MAMATADKSAKPEVATVEYVMDGDSLLVNTHSYYRKHQNLIDNPQVSCVVTSGEEKTLQFDARVELLSEQDAKEAKQKMLAAEPDFANYFNDTDTRFFCLKPYWMRLRDYTVEPEKITTIH